MELELIHFLKRDQCYATGFVLLCLEMQMLESQFDKLLNVQLLNVTLSI